MSLLRALQQYWRTPKGRHDIKDYARALLLILLTAAALVMLLYLVSD